ncbi:hypothetical protein C2W62_22645 [Candidatus Entotheonella serta]|nr:hypothetical protein C2W62_22645 [Candidatus Entotheonella serta]
MLFCLVIAHHTWANDLKKVWGGGPQHASAYSGVYVPILIDLLNQERLSGYEWGGPSAGTLQNVKTVHDNPTHLALAQNDLLSPLKDQYKFTVIKDDVGPECLYMMTKNDTYSNWGHVIGNAWDLTVATGSQQSGAWGTWQRLVSAYPALKDASVQHMSNAMDIVNAVINDKSAFGFFDMRPDPQNKVFAEIKKAGLKMIPVVDFDMEEFGYQYLSLKVAYGGLFSKPDVITTACTSVAVITGHPDNANPSDSRVAKRLQATIQRLCALPGQDFKPQSKSWRDMFDNLKLAAPDVVKNLKMKVKQTMAGLSD